jgi:probable F420-dependent oxidoreductase
MRVGAFYYNPDYGIEIGELARELEDRGFASLYVPEHTHIPTSRRTWRPDHQTASHAHIRDPFVALSFAAATTKKLLVGTSVCLIPERDPIVTAKCVASLDQLSDGRFILGIGGGWNVEEMENHGVRYETRFKVMREHVLAMKTLWTQEEASFHGQFVDFDPVWSWPKPVQRPHPPILLGGESDQTLRRVVEYCDGWIPRPSAGITPKAAVDRLRRMAEQKQRDAKSLSISMFSAAADEAALAEYREGGIDEVLLRIPDVSRDKILQLLDSSAPLT